MEDKLKAVIKPLYTALCHSISSNKEKLVPFCIQWGSRYPVSENTGILFVGKAVFKGNLQSTNVEDIFEHPDKKIFGRKNQMLWTHWHFDLPRKGTGYNIRSSAFWRVVRNISRKIYPVEWYSNIAWSNVYKISPASGGNPDNELRAQQEVLAQQILSKEIEVLSPKFVVFLTSGWEKKFVDNYKLGRNVSLVRSLKWDNGQYQTDIWKVDNLYFICSHHPQGKSEWPHSNRILEFIKQQMIDENDNIKVA